MDHQLINKWLDIPSEQWPPNHYTLLGLDRSVTDPAEIEHAVHRRLSKLRCYQLSHPELATTAMNQLAQAFMCLTDANAKAQYDTANGTATAVLPPPEHDDAELSQAQQTPQKPAKLPKALLDTDVASRTKVDWQVTPPPVRTEPAGTVPPPPPPPPPPPTTQPKTENVPTAIPADQDFHKAMTSADARRGLATIPAVLKRIDHTRQLLWAWEKVGRRLRKPAAKPTPAIEKDFNHWLEELAAWLADFPKVLGQPGQPGYRVVALTRLVDAYAMVQAMDARQKKELMADWQRGHFILTQHRRFLLYELKRLRNRSFVGRIIRAIRTAINDYPVRVVVVTSVLMALAFWYYMSQ